MPDDEELKRTLQSLALGRKRVLIKQPMSKDIGENDEFFFNAKFEDKARKVRINTIQVQETVRTGRLSRCSVLFRWLTE